jgi:hypothetical protein
MALIFPYAPAPSGAMDIGEVAMRGNASYFTTSLLVLLDATLGIELGDQGTHAT